MDTAARIALHRLGLLVVPDGSRTPAVIAGALAELAHAGVRLTNPEQVTDAVTADLPALVQSLRAARGERGRYAPLFRGFPDKLPAWDDAALRFAFALSRLAAGLDEAALVRLGAGRLTGDDGGVLVSDQQWAQALDFTDIGWWPASSIPQDPDLAALAQAAQAVLPGDSRTSWTTLTVVRPDQLAPALRAWVAACFAAAASLREDVRADLDTLIGIVGVEHVDPATARFAETRVLLHQLLWRGNPARLREAGLSPDDVLRLMAALTGSDVSLARKITFPPLTRAQRRLLVAILEASPRLDDVFRRRGLWLALARGLHLSEHDAPRTAEVFARLRAGKANRASTLSRFERTLPVDPAAAVALLAAEAPGVLARQLRRLGVVCAQAGEEAWGSLLGEVAGLGDRVPLRVLLAARAGLDDNGATYPRVAVTKTGAALPIARTPGHLALDSEHQMELLLAVHSACAQAARALPVPAGTGQDEQGGWAGRRVWFDPAVGGLLVPDGLRTTVPGLTQVERGSRLGLDWAPVLRLFVHWREGDERSDLDLSCIVLDENFAQVDQVSWTNLAAGAITHSGDVTSAPLGAQEFIDVRLDAARARPGWRYLLPVVFRYSGPSFAELPEAWAGWMLREKASSDRATFDAKTVVNAFALTGRRATCVPFAVDLHREQVIATDLYVASAWGARVERDGVGLAELVRASAQRAAFKASIADLVCLHATAHEAILVTDRSKADITVGVDEGCTYDARRPEKLLADLL